MHKLLCYVSAVWTFSYRLLDILVLIQEIKYPVFKALMFRDP